MPHLKKKTLFYIVSSAISTECKCFRSFRHDPRGLSDTIMDMYTEGSATDAGQNLWSLWRFFRIAESVGRPASNFNGEACAPVSAQESPKREQPARKKVAAFGHRFASCPPQ